MSETIEDLQEALADRGQPPDQVQREGASSAQHEGTYVCGQQGEVFVVRQVGRTEAEDRREVFGSEAEAVEVLRGRVLGAPGRSTTAAEQAEIRARMQRRAQETLDRLHAGE